MNSLWTFVLRFLGFALDGVRAAMAWLLLGFISDADLSMLLWLMFCWKMAVRECSLSSFELSLTTLSYSGRTAGVVASLVS